MWPGKGTKGAWKEAHKGEKKGNMSQTFKVAQQQDEDITFQTVKWNNYHLGVNSGP